MNLSSILNFFIQYVNFLLRSVLIPFCIILLNKTKTLPFTGLPFSQPFFLPSQLFLLISSEIVFWMLGVVFVFFPFSTYLNLKALLVSLLIRLYSVYYSWIIFCCCSGCISWSKSFIRHLRIAKFLCPCTFQMS